MQKYAESGTEQYMKYAEKELGKLSDLRKDLNLPFMVKHKVPADGVLVRVESAEMGDKIYITGGMRYFATSTLADPVPYRSITMPFVGDGWTVVEDEGGTYTIRVNPRVGPVISDGTELAATSISYLDSITYRLTNWHQYPTPFITVPTEQTATWSGGSSFDLYSVAPIDGPDGPTSPYFAVVGTVDFVVPSDIKNPFASGYNLSVPSGYSIAGYDEVAAKARWDAGRIEGAEREEARLLANSRTFINNLRAGILYTSYSSQPRNWEALRSLLPVFPTGFTATLIGDEPSIDGTTEGTRTYTRTIQLSYTDSGGTTHTQIVEGSLTVTVTFHYVPGNEVSAFTSHRYSFVNWPLFNITTGLYNSSLAPLLDAVKGIYSEDLGPHRDGAFSLPLGLIANGVHVSGLPPDSATGFPSLPPSYYSSTPETPAASSTVVLSTAQLYKDYLRDVKPVEGLESNPAGWNTASLLAGDTVTVIPVGPIRKGREQGVFGDVTGSNDPTMQQDEPEEQEWADKVAIYGAAKFRYNLDGSFTFVSWTDADKVNSTYKEYFWYHFISKQKLAEFADIPYVESMSKADIIAARPQDWWYSHKRLSFPESNTVLRNSCVVVYDKFHWTDTKDQAREDAADLKQVMNEEAVFYNLFIPAMAKDAMGL